MGRARIGHPGDRNPVGGLDPGPEVGVDFREGLGPDLGLRVNLQGVQDIHTV